MIELIVRVTRTKQSNFCASCEFAHLEIITFLPNFLASIDITSELVSNLSVEIHSIAGIVCSLFGLYLGLSENKRITNVDLAYREVEKEFPDEYCVKKIDKHPTKLRINITLCLVMYSITILLAIANMIFS